jgi:hypothetical protein
MFINVPSEHPDDQLHKQHKIQTRVTEDNKEETYQTRTKQTAEYLNHYHT